MPVSSIPQILPVRHGLRLLLASVCLACTITGTAQVGISTTSITPDPSSLLELRSNAKGMLVPRMATTDRDVILSPATGLLIYNTTTNSFNYYNGSTWQAFGTTAGTVTSITGTSNRITISGTAADPVLDISSAYTGQSSITALGTISSGTWNGTLLSPAVGGTGINNGTKTITLGGNLTTLGSFSTNFTSTGNTSVTLPVSGTLTTLAGTETLTNKTLSSPVIGTILNTGTLTLPTTSGTVALTSQITGTNTGTNTGDETTARINTLYGYTPANAATVAANTASIALKVNISDTAAMLSPYVRAIKASADSALLAGRINTNNSSVALKVNYTDTASMLNPYAQKVKVVADSAVLAGRINTNNTSVALKVNYTDTASMLSPYVRAIKESADSALLAGRINTNTTNLALKLNYTDTAAMLSPYLQSTVAAAAYVSLGGSYANPMWLTSLAWSKLTGTPTTVAGYNISDAITLTGTQTLTNKTLTTPIITSPTGLVKADVGLGNADNTSDLNKPVSTATQTALGLKINTLDKGNANGVASLDAGGKVPITQMAVGPQVYKGTWNAATNTPTLSDATGKSGDTYRVVVTGTVNLGSGNVTFNANDDAIHNGTIWQRNPATYAVTTVNGLSGTVVLGSDQVTEGTTNKYYTDSRAALKINVSDKGVNNGVATLDASGKIPSTQLPVGAQQYKGTWNAATNTPALADGTGTAGWTYRCTTSGTQNLGSGIQAFTAGDDVIYNGSVWQRSGSTATVTSVNTQTGNVVLTSDNINEGSTNLYFTAARTRSNVSANSPLTYSSSSGVFSLPQATSSVSGYLNFTDWVTFNQKQAAGNYVTDPGGNGFMARTALNISTFRTITGTANRLTVTNGSGASGDPTLDISSAYAGQATITTLGTVATGTWNGSTIGIGYGGTNSSTALNNNRIMVSSAGSIKEAGALTNGQLLIGSTSSAPAAATLIAGNGIAITDGPGSIQIDNQPAISQLTSSTAVTTTSTTDVALSNPLSVTPGAGDYLVFFNAMVSNSNAGRGTIMSLYVNGSKITTSETQTTSGQSNDKNTISTMAYVTGLTAGQAIEVRWRTESNTSTITNRTLILQKVK